MRSADCRRDFVSNLVGLSGGVRRPEGSRSVAEVLALRAATNGVRTFVVVWIPVSGAIVRGGGAY